MSVQISLFREFFATFTANQWVCVNFFMYCQNIFSEKFLGTVRTVKISLSCFANSNMS